MIPIFPATPFTVCARRSASLVSPLLSAAAISEAGSPFRRKLHQQVAIETLVASNSPQTIGHINTRYLRQNYLICGSYGCRLRLDGLLPVRLRPSQQRGKQDLRINRLRHMIIHACVNAALAFFNKGVSRHRDDGKLLQARVDSAIVWSP